MSSSASLLRPSASLDGCCLEAGAGLLSPRLSAGGEVAAAAAFSPRATSVLDGAKGGRASCDLPLSPADAALAAKLRGTWQLAAVGKPAAAAVLADLQVQRIADGGPDGVKALASKVIAQHQLDDTFYVVDLANVVRLYKAWRAAMPRVVPFYAIKCNPDAGMVRLLAALGAGFDCASLGEVSQVLDLGVAPSRIIFAHPCKRPCDIRYARERGVSLTTFDTESELVKIAGLFPGFRLVLRIRADDPEARVPLGLKYGADPEEAPRLLRAARRLGLDVVGVSFHVGSACRNLAAYSAAIEKARGIFDLGAELGFANMNLLDIGGGFTGRFDACGNVMFGDIATTINGALAAHFPPEAGVQVIAEPGRYFAETAGSLLTPVYGTRDRPVVAAGSGGGPSDGGATTAAAAAVVPGVHRDYWITDGLYGSFNCILYDGQNPEYLVLRSPLLPPLPAGAPVPSYVSTVWGPTCDSADCVYKDVTLPHLRNGDWLLFPNAGAYTVAGACDFNGINMTAPRLFYVWSEATHAALCPAAAAEAEAEQQPAAAAEPMTAEPAAA